MAATASPARCFIRSGCALPSAAVGTMMNGYATCAALAITIATPPTSAPVFLPFEASFLSATTLKSRTRVARWICARQCAGNRRNTAAATMTARRQSDPSVTHAMQGRKRNSAHARRMAAKMGAGIRERKRVGRRLSCGQLAHSRWITDGTLHTHHAVWFSAPVTVEKAPETNRRDVSRRDAGVDGDDVLLSKKPTQHNTRTIREASWTALPCPNTYGKTVGARIPRNRTSTAAVIRTFRDSSTQGGLARRWS